MSLVGFLAGVGALTLAVLGVGTVYYVATRRPTPAGSLRETLRGGRWGFGFAMFVLPPAAVGYTEEGVGLAVYGASMGVAMLGWMVLLGWWWDV